MVVDNDDDPFAPLPDEIEITLTPDEVKKLISDLADRYRFALSLFYIQSRSPFSVFYLPALVKLQAQLEFAIRFNSLLSKENRS